MTIVSKSLWDTLRESATDEARKGWIRRRLPSHPSVRLWAGIRVADALPALMLEVAKSHLAQGESLPSTDGLRIDSVRLDTEPNGSLTIIVSLRDKAYEDIFTAFCDDTANRLSYCRSAEEAADTFLLRLKRWQRFLNSGKDGLTRNEEVGLFGELHVLSNYLLPISGLAAVTSWFGPNDRSQDFISPSNAAIEVKTTSANVMSHVRISSEYQLDDSGFKALFLICMRLEIPEKGGRTLNQLVDELRNSVASSPEMSDLLAIKLTDAGYLERHRSRYDVRRFRVAELVIFRVSAGFPRILTSNVPSGITEMSYLLQLAECRAFAVTDGAMLDQLGENLKQSTGITGGNPK
jgi:hypothetical protein